MRWIEAMLSKDNRSHRWVHDKEVNQVRRFPEWQVVLDTDGLLIICNRRTQTSFWIYVREDLVQS